MVHTAVAVPPSAKVARTSWGIAGGLVAILGAVAGVLPALVILLALIGTPLFAILGGSAELAWLTSKDPGQHHLRFIATTVLDERFAGSPILVTIPLFTFVGYVLAEAKTPDRLVHAARALLGWMPGGLAIVCVIASAIFTVLTGGSGVTIIAIGGLLYPALRKQGYSEKFSLGLVTTGGSVGLLLPYSLPLLVYCLVARVDFTKAFKAVLLPGGLVIVLLSVYAAVVASREKVPREPPRWSEIGSALWALRWELFIPVLLIVGLTTGLTSIDEVAALVAFYVVVIEFFVYGDLSFKKDFSRIAKAAMSLAGAIMLILAMANSLMHFVVDQDIPKDVLAFMLKIGIEHRWQLLLVMNVFLLVLGMLMEGFSAIFVAVPLIIPFVADLAERHPDEAMSPFQLAMIFLLNLEIAYCIPPLGLNLFIASFRFNRPVASLYRVVLPFAGILAVALLLVSYVPWISTALVKGDIAALRAEAEHDHVAPRDAWDLECVQLDPTTPVPCSLEDRKKYAAGNINLVPIPSGDGGAEEGGGAPSETDDFAAWEAQQAAEQAAAEGGAADAGTE
jgi:C4-dicarboxylate transporter DctM subunit